MTKARMYTTSGDGWTDTHLTDPRLVRALGPFDLDPCCPPDMPWRTAKRMLTPAEDGLKRAWRGRVWMNPPYRKNLPWALKFAMHGSGCALLSGRATQTKATQTVLRSCAAVFLFAERLTFHRPDGAPHQGKWFNSILIGMTPGDVQVMAELPERGFPGVLLLATRVGQRI